MAPLYGGASKDRDRERLSAVATDITWRLLTTSLGARRVRDAESFERVFRASRALQSELASLSAQVDLADVAPADPARPSVEHLVEEVNRLMRSRDLHRQERRVREQLDRLAVELEQIRHSKARLVAVPDDEPEAVEVDLDAIERAIAAEQHASPALVATRGGGPARIWISANEMRDLSGSSSPTIRRWLNGAVPFADGDPRNPWPAERVPVDDSLGEKRRRILVAGISKRWLAQVPGRNERLLDLLRTPVPGGWSSQLAAAPLQSPEWLE
jgi:hypothetical protein